MLSNKIQNAINSQVNAELYSSYLYVAMAMYFESIDMSGAAKWMNAQAQEELVHADKFMHYVNERGGRVLLEVRRAANATGRAEPISRGAARLPASAAGVLHVRGSSGSRASGYASHGRVESGELRVASRGGAGGDRPGRVGPTPITGTAQAERG